MTADERLDAIMRAVREMAARHNEHTVPALDAKLALAAARLGEAGQILGRLVRTAR